MIKQRQVFQDLIVEYSGTPSISVTVDGSSKLSNLALPTHSNRQTRIVSLPAGVIGYVPQLTTSTLTFSDISLEVSGGTI